MELRQIRYFLAVAETLSFSRAAERLRVAQPALSRQIRSLEDELGVQLFVRSTVRVRLTDAGRNLHDKLGRLKTEFDEAIASTREVARGISGHFEVGTDWRLPMPELLKAVRRFREGHPKVTVNLVDLPLHEQIPALREGRIHLGIVPTGYLGAHEDLEVLRLSTAELRVALPYSHPLAADTRVRLRQLKDETWLLLDERSSPGFRVQITQLCRLAQFTPRVGGTASSMAGLLAHVATGDGICLVPDSLVPKPENEMLRFPLTDCAPMELFAVWMREGTVPLVHSFVAELKNQLSPGPEGRPEAPEDRKPRS